MGKTIRGPVEATATLPDQNTIYDLQTAAVIWHCLAKGGNGVDVGAHQGEILRNIVEASPAGKHIAIEPIPQLALELQQGFKDVSVFNLAVADYEGEANFNYVNTNPAYSGLLKRNYDRPEKDENIRVSVNKLDNLIPANLNIDFMKIDVEGGEFAVLKGAVELLCRCKPLLVYEQGLGAANIYGTEPGEFFDFLRGFGYKISLMEYYLANKEALSREEYCYQFIKGYNYYFIAY